MGKIKIRTGRGTGTIEVDDAKQKISGDEYKKLQAAKKKAAGNRMVHTDFKQQRKKQQEIGWSIQVEVLVQEN